MEPLLRQLLESPEDRGRLLVYADWLEERADPRAAYARAQLDHREGNSPGLERLRALYPHDRPDWVGTLETSGAFVANLLPIEAAWWGVGVGSQENGSTYTAFENDARPPLPYTRFDGTFAWLRETGTPYPGDTAADEEAWRARLDGLEAEGFNVPVALRRFLSDRALHELIPSCTANFVLASEDAVISETEAGSVLPFYCDQQWCVLWGIRLGRGEDAYSPVISGNPTFGDDGPTGMEDVVFASSTVEGFLYRWRIENAIWYAREMERRELSPEEAAYQAFY